MNYVIWLLMRYPYIAGHAYLFLTDSLILAIIFILKDLNQNLTSKFQRNDINCQRSIQQFRNFLRKMYWHHIRMNTIKDDRNREDKNDLIQVEKWYVCWFYCASKIIAVVSKESTFIFFAKTRTGIKHLKVFYINTMCPLCHLSQRIHINLVSLYLDHSVQTQTSTNHSDNRS